MKKSFFWPISHNDILVFRDRITNKLIKFLSKNDSNDQEYRIINVLINYIIIDSLEIFRAFKLLRFSDNDHKNWDIERGSRILSALKEKQIPKEPSIVKELMLGPPRPKRILFPLRFLRSKIYQKNIIRYPLKRINFEKDIISLSSYKLIECHAKLVKQRVIFLQPYNFLNKIESKSYNFNEEIISEISKCLNESLSYFSINIDTVIKKYFENWLMKSASIVKYHYKSLEYLKKPRILWTGSGAQIWSRILRSYFIDKGTFIVGFDHGSGCSHVKDCYKSIRDFEFCNQFISFTKGQTIELKKNLK